jgi:glycosyltransferase involved in cell wall biosynthesis
MTPRLSSVLVVSPSDRGGGAEMVAWKLMDACRARGVSGRMVVGARRGDDPDVIELDNDRYRGPWARLWLRLAQQLRWPRLRHAGEPLRWLAYRLGREDMDFPASGRILELAGVDIGLLHGHNLHGLDGGFFDLRVLPALSRRVPALLTLHDAWLLAGHCAHSFDCERWLTGCGACPYLDVPEVLRRDGSVANWKLREEVFRDSSLWVATPCRWLMERVQRSVIAPAIQEERVIPHGVDLGVFYPGDRIEARRRLGLDPATRMVLCLGNTVRSNIWRDFDAAVRAVRGADVEVGERVILVALGETGSRADSDDSEILEVEHCEDPNRVADYLRAADVFLHPALADTFPSAVVEAMACGVPVVAFSVGGIPEQVVDGETGFLIDPGDISAMCGRIGILLRDRSLQQQFGRGGAAVAAKRFDFETTVDRYLDLYQQMAASVGRRIQ